MDASCKEAKRPRKWLLSVIAAVIAVVSCSSILAPQSVYADPEGEEPTNIKEECISSGAAKSSRLISNFPCSLILLKIFLARSSPLLQPSVTFRE